MFSSGAAINVNRAPRIFRKVFEKRIPSRRPWVTFGLSHTCLQSLLSSRIKTVHRLVLRQLGANRLTAGPTGGLCSKAGEPPAPRHRVTEHAPNDTNHDHD